MVLASPLPQVERRHTIDLDGHHLHYLPGSYEYGEAPRFGEKLNIGPLQYSDFSPYDQAHAVSSLIGGYGLRRYSDHPDREKAALMFAESVGINTRGVPITLADRQTPITLPGSTGAPVWGGDFAPAGQPARYVVVAGTRVYTIDASLTPTDTGITLPAPALQGAVGVYENSLVIGFGEAAPAVRSINLTSTVPLRQDDGQPIYVWAATADHAAAYVAGGPQIDDWDVVMSSEDLDLGFEVDSATPCGTHARPITALAPGGGVALVFVGLEDQLGCIDSTGTYNTLVPFDSRRGGAGGAPANCRGMRWQMAHGADEQRGPVVLYFPRDRALWTYEPSNEQSGTAQNVSPWADPYRRPLSVRGAVTAIQGSARWIYYAVENLVGETWIVVRDTRSGQPHIFAEVGLGGCHFIGITTLLGTNPKLLFGRGTDLAAITLALDGDLPLDDPACPYIDVGSLWLSEIDLGFPDEDKITFSTRIVADGLVPEHQFIQVWQSADGGPYELIGTAAQSPRAEIHAPSQVVRRLGIRLDFFSDDPAKTPKLYALTVRMFLNTRLYRTWQFTVAVPSGSNAFGADWLENPQRVLEDLWEARKAGFPVDFVDRWGKPWEVRIFHLTEREVLRELDRPPETHLQVVLLEVQEGDQVGASWSSPPAPAGTGTFIPVVFS